MKKMFNPEHFVVQTRYVEDTNGPYNDFHLCLW